MNVYFRVERMGEIKTLAITEMTDDETAIVLKDFTHDELIKLVCLLANRIFQLCDTLKVIKNYCDDQYNETETDKSECVDSIADEIREELDWGFED